MVSIYPREYVRVLACEHGKIEFNSRRRQASILDTATTAAATQTELYGVFQDAPTDFVFVKLRHGWVFAGSDGVDRHHEVFLDASTRYVFVKLSTGWKFLGTAK